MNANSWNEGYVTDIDYTYGYYRELNPVFLNFCLLLSGYKAPNLSQNLNYCELGFGQGISLNIHAVANGKNLTCYGTDFNPSQTAFAKELASFNVNQNVHCFDDSFADLLAKSENLPNFDYIVLHGIWSWISRENQQHIVDFIAKKLNPGGVVYVSYNALPGRNFEQPFQKLLDIHEKFFASPNENALERVDSALNFADKIFSATKNNADLVEQVKRFKQASSNKHYLNHEYFNKDWRCEYFCDVAEKMATAKMDFACKSDFLLTPENAIVDNDKGKRLLNRISSKIAKEQILDFLINSGFRRDIYIKGLRNISSAEQQQTLLNTYFVSNTIAGSTLPQLGNLKVETCNAIFGALFKFESKPKTLQEILDLTPKNLDRKLIIDGVLLLVAHGFVFPCKDIKTISQQEITNAQKYNHKICQMAFKNSVNYMLANPLTGGCVIVSHLTMILLSQIYENPHKELKANELAKFAFATYKNLGVMHHRQIRENDQEITKIAQNDDENLEFIRLSVNDFLNKELVLYKATKVV